MKNWIAVALLVFNSACGLDMLIDSEAVEQYLCSSDGDPCDSTDPKCCDETQCTLTHLTETGTFYFACLPIEERG